MPEVVLGRPPMVPVGVAVPAPVRAGVIGADVARLEAVAPGAHAPVPERTELHAVGAPKDVERHAAARVNAVAREVPAGPAGLKPEAVLGRNGAEHPREVVHVLHGERHELGHVEAQLPVHLHEGKDAAVHMRCQHVAHAREGLAVTLEGVGGREQHRIVAPRDATRAHLVGQLDERLHALLDARNAGLNVLAVGGYRVVEVGVEPVRDLIQARQDGSIVLGAEDHAVHDRRVQLVARHLVGEERVSRQDVALLEAAQQPGGVVLDGVGARARVDDHSSPPPKAPAQPQ